MDTVNLSFENFSVHTTNKRHLRKFHTTWATLTVKIHNLEYYRSTDPLDALKGIFNTILEHIITPARQNDMFQIAVIAGEDSTFTPLSSRFLPGYKYAADTILDRFSHLLNSHEELNLADPFSIDITHVAPSADSSPAIANHMHANAD